MIYSVGDYGEMIADKARMDPYIYALKAVIKPGTVVVDIGTGTRVAFINLEPVESGIPAAIGRLEGYRRALDAFGVAHDPALEQAQMNEPDSGYDLTHQFMDLNDPHSVYLKRKVPGSDFVRAL